MSNYTNNQEPTLWSTYHDIKAVLEAPAIEKRQVQVLVDDSKRIVDMTLIQPNLYIGAELVFLLLCYSIPKYTYNCIRGVRDTTTVPLASSFVI